MRIRALVIRIIRQFLHDRRTLALLIVAPLLVLTLMYLVFNGDAYRPRIGVLDLPTAIADRLRETDASVKSYETKAAAEGALAAQDIDALLRIEDGTLLIKLEGSEPSRNRAVLLAIPQALQGLDKAAGGDSQSPASPFAGQTPEIEYLHGGADMTSFDSLSPVLIGFFAFFFVFLIAGVSFLRERTSGTLERLLATPLHRWEIVVGYMMGFGIFTCLQAMLIAGYAIGALGSLMVGSFGLVVLIMLLLSLNALSFGVLLSTYANSEFQMIQFIPIVIVPQVFFSGLFDLETLSPWLRWIANITPLKYGADALKSVMIRGEGWSSIALDVYVLAGLTLLFMAANVWALRKHRKI
ncbi:ABC transporter permease [Gorillibacterium sp. CAU 1737]|uniref:ABC transporter permease n=1 Tax=Gorillibacterium sp. CAU 1737 TaxID=3140362 RepID=UPI00325FFC27